MYEIVRNQLHQFSNYIYIYKKLKKEEWIFEYQIKHKKYKQTKWVSIDPS